MSERHIPEDFIEALRKAGAPKDLMEAVRGTPRSGSRRKNFLDRIFGWFKSPASPEIPECDQPQPSSKFNVYDLAREFTRNMPSPSAEKLACLLASSWRADMLKAIADEEIEINDPDLLDTICNLLEDEDLNVQRSAAIALHYGGEKAQEALSAYITKSKNKDIERLIKLIYNSSLSHGKFSNRYELIDRGSIIAAPLETPEEFAAGVDDFLEWVSEDECHWRLQALADAIRTRDNQIRKQERQQVLREVSRQLGPKNGHTIKGWCANE